MLRPLPYCDDALSGRKVKKHQHKHSLKRRFQVLETLGRGAYGKVKRAVERRCGKTVAIKSIRKERLRDDLDRAHIQREIEISASLVHPHIIRLYEGKSHQQSHNIRVCVSREIFP
uniref:non-specific serine/threonine protein kinase n=1 Tax=Sinocyclocheilus rhinocerous TaxID=307959 RepID=A0A673KCL1_9TELE